MYFHQRFVPNTNANNRHCALCHPANWCWSSFSQSSRFLTLAYWKRLDFLCCICQHKLACNLHVVCRTLHHRHIERQIVFAYCKNPQLWVEDSRERKKPSTTIRTEWTDWQKGCIQISIIINMISLWGVCGWRWICCWKFELIYFQVARHGIDGVPENFTLEVYS